MSGSKLMSNLFQLTDDQWRKIEPLIPDDPAWPEAETQPWNPQRYSARAEKRLPLARLPEGVWSPHHRQSPSLQCRRNVWPAPSANGICNSI